MESVPHQPGWAGRAAREMARVRRALGAGCMDVHHVGSTSVPGIEAVPIIDLGVAIEAVAVLDAARLRLIAHGFRAAAPVDRWPVLRARCPMTQQTQVEVTCFLPTDPALRQVVALFAHLRARPQAAREYELLKRSARARHPDPQAYAVAKRDWVWQQLQQLGAAT